VLSKPTEELLLLSIADVAAQLRPLVPERHSDNLAQQLAWMSISMPVSVALLPLFALAAFFASNNNLKASCIDAFLGWITEEEHEESLVRFMTIQTPTIHAFANALIDSAIRTKNAQALEAIRNGASDYDMPLYRLASIGDAALLRRLLDNAEPADLTGETGARLLHRFVLDQKFDLARLLLDKGVFVDVRLGGKTALYQAVRCKVTRGIEFLLRAGADPNLYHKHLPSTTPSGYAVFSGYEEAIGLFLEHGVAILGKIRGMPALEWASLHRRSILETLKRLMHPETAAQFFLGDLVDAANRGAGVLAAYIAAHPEDTTESQLERALEKSIQGNHLMATITLLQHGVSPDGPSLYTPPLLTALNKQPENPAFAELLVQHGADVRQPGMLGELARRRRVVDLLEAVLASPIDEMQGRDALASAAIEGNVASAAALIRAGVDVDTFGRGIMTPLQAAASRGKVDMVGFLLSRGANVNTPAHPDGGRTALQAALAGEAPVEVAEILLHHGADVAAPPALLNGVTALEAYCNNPLHDGDPGMCEKLLDAGATVNRLGGKPSSALHGAVRRRWHKILRRFLWPHHSAIINHMWCDQIYEDDDPEWEPRTPTQLAASLGDLGALRILLGMPESRAFFTPFIRSFPCSNDH
jgi:ankyrin repeat protein